MDEVWSQLPNDLIEHIARFADIDTRRAMGFLPKKLPPSDFNIPGIVTRDEHYTKIDFENATLCVNNQGDRQFFKGRVIMTSVFGSLLLEDENGMMCIINPDSIPFKFEYIATF
jgi:hypothetical protein